MVIRLLTVSTARALHARVELESRGCSIEIPPLCRCCHCWWLLYTPRINGRVRGGGGGDGGGMEMPQHSGAKWGDRDNDNVRSALAGGLL